MRVLIQRSKNSNVVIDNKIIGKIDKGLVVFSCFCENDSQKDIDYIVNKILKLRIFDDENGVMNKNILESEGSILSISQFTLYADVKSGNRPSYFKALKGKEAIKLYDLFNEKLRSNIHTETGIFGSDMLVNIQNDGPITIVIDSK